MLSKFCAVFGFVYFLFNMIYLAVFAILIVYSWFSSKNDPGAVMLALPVLGLFVGSWIRHGQFDWWRVALIVLSMLCTFSAIYLGFFMPAVLK